MTIRAEPVVTFNFAVEIEGLLVGGFTEVTGLVGRIDMQDQPEGGVNGYVQKLPGTASFDNLVLRRGLTSSTALWDWYHRTANGIIARKNGTILLLDCRQAPVMGWNFRNALPVEWTGPTFDASSDQVGFESLELVHEGLARAMIVQLPRVGS